MSLLGLSCDDGALQPSLQRIATELDRLFDLILAVPTDPRSRLLDAMRHAAIGGGKRLRPALVLASSQLFGVEQRHALRAGLAVECVHVHSLVHDDLPCMDDDDLRRGKPTVHVAFDEATAVLAGDSFLALAFEILCSEDAHPLASVRAELACTLARSVGADGMAGGQMLDLLPMEQGADVESIARLQRLKTGALIEWSVDAGAILGGATPDQRTSLRGYARKLGLAFQIADDLLDHQGDESVVGKRVGKDQQQGKATFVSLLGADRAERQAEVLVDQAIDHLRCFDDRAFLLAQIAEFAIRRER